MQELLAPSPDEGANLDPKPSERQRIEIPQQIVIAPIIAPQEERPQNRPQIAANQGAGESSGDDGRRGAASPVDSRDLAERGHDKRVPQQKTSKDEPLDDRDAEYDLTFLTAPPIRERRAVWQTASRWSLAAAIYAKGYEAERWQPMLDEAQAAADELALALPPFPSVDLDGELADAVTRALQGEAGANLTSAVSRRLNARAGAAAQLAIETNLLLLNYAPAGIGRYGTPIGFAISRVSRLSRSASGRRWLNCFGRGRNSLRSKRRC